MGNYGSDYCTLLTSPTSGLQMMLPQRLYNLEQYYITNSFKYDSTHNNEYNTLYIIKSILYNKVLYVKCQAYYITCYMTGSITFKINVTYIINCQVRCRLYNTLCMALYLSSKFNVILNITNLCCYIISEVEWQECVELFHCYVYCYLTCYITFESRAPRPPPGPFFPFQSACTLICSIWEAKRV